MNPSEIMERISKTLQQVTIVSTRENLDRMLGCIQLLDELSEKMRALEQGLSGEQEGEHVQPDRE